MPATSSLLLPEGYGGFVAFDYLIDAADKVPLPAAALEQLIAFATADEATDIGHAAWLWFQFDQAESAFRAAQAQGNWRAAATMSDFLHESDGPERALRFRARLGLRQGLAVPGLMSHLALPPESRPSTRQPGRCHCLKFSDQLREAVTEEGIYPRLGQHVPARTSPTLR